MPCDMCELAQQLPEGGQRGDLVAGNNIQAEGFGGNMIDRDSGGF